MQKIFFHFVFFRPYRPAKTKKQINKVLLSERERRKEDEKITDKRRDGKTTRRDGMTTMTTMTTTTTTTRILGLLVMGLAVTAVSGAPASRWAPKYWPPNQVLILRPGQSGFLECAAPDFETWEFCAWKLAESGAATLGDDDDETG